jgi:hypothetical protein
MSVPDKPWWLKEDEELHFITMNRTMKGKFLGISGMEIPESPNKFYAVVQYSIIGGGTVTEFINIDHIISVQETN